MSLTIGTPIEAKRVVGDRQEIILPVTGDTSYPTGGYPVTAALVGLNTIETVVPVLVKAATGAASVDYDYTTGNLLAYTTAGAQTTNATNVSTLKAILVIKGW